jgi:hypothetical protein
VDFESAQYRANPGYEAVAFRGAESAQAIASDSGIDGPDLFGMLQPRPGTALPPQLISRDTALLFFSLLEPGPLPAWLLRQGKAARLQDIRRLVLDRVIEVASPQGFVCGAAAVDCLAANPAESRLSRLADLSRQALRYAEALGLADAMRVAGRLYAYNRVPAGPAWNARLSSPEAVVRFLLLDVGASNERVLGRCWHLSGASDGWHRFAARRLRDARRADHCKLYVSPSPGLLPALIEPVADALAAAGATQFKLGADLTGVLRPDKLVAYFADRDALVRAAEVLTARLAGTAAQGVPFTAQIDADGLLSWGMDPPPHIAGGRDSWRTWVVWRLATALVGAASAPETSMVELASTPPWRLALARLATDGVDPATFAPTANWAEADAA